MTEENEKKAKVRRKKKTKSALEIGVAGLVDKWVEEKGGSPEAILGKSGLLMELRKAVVERMLAGELTHHLGYKKGEEPVGENCRNGRSRKTLVSQDGKMEIEVPRDRESSFEPKIVPKGAKRFMGFDEKIIGMYARGMSVREIQGFLLEEYQVEVSADLISTVTDEVMEAVVEWQNRPLERMYPIVFFDALRVKIRDEGTVKNKAVYLALGVMADGTRDVLGLWIEQNEGAKFWLRVMNELRNRGVEDLLIAVVDGLKGFPEAINQAFPQTTVQTCIVHLTRFSLAYCSWKDRKEVAGMLQTIYRAVTAEEASLRLKEFEESALGKKYALIGPSWRRHWEEVIPFFSYPPEIRKLIYTTNAIESLHMQLRKILKSRGHFPSDAAATKLIYLCLRKIIRGWIGKTQHWQEAMNQFAIMFGHRFVPGLAQEQQSKKP